MQITDAGFTLDTPDGFAQWLAHLEMHGEPALAAVMRLELAEERAEMYWSDDAFIVECLASAIYHECQNVQQKYVYARDQKGYTTDSCPIGGRYLHLRDALRADGVRPVYQPAPTAEAEAATV